MAFGACVILIFLDQITKLLAVTYLKGNNGIDILPGIFKLYYLENQGAAFGILQHQMILFSVLTIVFLAVFSLFYLKLPISKKFLPLRVVTVFFVAGAVGNFIDRIVHQYVIDFLYFVLIDFPVFNVADIYVTCACVAFIIMILFIYKEEDLNGIFKKRG